MGEKKEQIVWLDYLRILACFLVVLSHSTDPFTVQVGNNIAEYNTAVYVGSLVRSCVPLFVMISGVLLFPLNGSLSQFYSKRFKRILLPMIFWAILTPVFYYLYFNYIVGGTDNLGVNIENYSAQPTLVKMYTFIFNFNYDTTPFWYLYMLIGLYLIIPIIGSWLEKASKKDLKVVISIWLFTTIIPYLKILAPILGYTGNYGNMGMFGECDWNAYGSFYYLSGFVGYLFLAQYLIRYPREWSFTKTSIISFSLFIVGYLITYFGFQKMGELYPGNYAYIEIPWYFTNINVLMMTLGIFLFFSKLQLKKSKLIAKLSSLTFGVYLIHFLIVQISYDVIHTYIKTLPIVQIILIALGAFLISLLITYLLSSNRATRKTVM